MDSKEAIIKHEKLKSYWSNETRLTQRLIISLLIKLEEISDKLEYMKPKKKKIKRKLSKWQEFIRVGLKEGKTIQQLSKEWKANKLLLLKQSSKEVKR